MTSVDSVLFQRLQHYAAYRDFNTAIFIAEQLFAAFKQQQQQQHQNQSHLSSIFSSYLPSASQPPPNPTPPLLHPLVLLLAQCYIDSGPADLPRAHHLLSTTLTPLCPTTPHPHSAYEPQHRYLLAHVSLRLDLLHEAEVCLLPLLTHPDFTNLPSAASCLSLLGVVCQRTGRVDEAIRYHTRALEVDGMLWSSYSALCQLGVKVDVSTLFTVDIPSNNQPPLTTTLLPQHLSTAAASASTQSSVALTPLPSFQHTAIEQTTPLTNSALQSPSATTAATPRLTKQPSTSHTRTPSTTSSSLKSSLKRPTTTTPTTSSATPLAAGQQRLTFQSTKPKKDTTLKPTKPVKSETSGGGGGGRGVVVHSRIKSWSSVTPLSGGVRKRLDEIVDMEPSDNAATTTDAVTEEGAENELKEERGGGAAMETSETGPLASPVPTSTSQSEDEATADEVRRQNERLARSAARYTTLFRTLASAHSALSLCHPRTCVRLLSTLSFDHAHSPFALSSLARAHFDLVDYPTALRHWQQLHTLHPHHLHSLDLYSTALWQCKRDTLLASLAHTLTPHHATHHITLTVLGNTFSLQREHDTALRFFRRSVQLNPHYAYGWVLVGHECVVLEEWEGAVEAYRSAVGVDGRMYGGWYGLGQVYYHQEKWTTALYHFTRALSINTQSPLLRVYVAMTLVQLSRLDEALNVLLELDNVQQAEIDLATAATAHLIATQQSTSSDTDSTAQHTVHPQVQYQLANIYVLREDWAAALQACERLESVVWRESSVYVLMGRVYRAMGDVDAAMRCWVLALELDPKDSNGVKGMMEAMCKREAKRKTAAAKGEQLVEEVEEQEMDVGY